MVAQIISSYVLPILVALAFGRSRAGILGSNPAGGVDVSCECRVLSRRGLCVQLLIHPEDS
jgi:hypothetical protein